MQTVNEAIRDAYILRSLLLEQLKNKYSNNIQNEYKNILDDIIRQLNKYAEIDLSNMNKLISEIRDRINPNIVLVSDLEQLAISESLFVQGAINSAITINIINKLPKDNLLTRIASTNIFEGNTVKDTFKMFDDKLKHDLRGEINQSVIQGESISQIAQRIKDRFQMAYRQADTIARTATHTLVGKIRQNIYEENEDIFKGYEWNSVLDSRVRITHAVRDGKTWTLKHKPINHSYKFYVPYEYNCRCIITPIVKSYKQLGFDIHELDSLTRASIDGEVPATITFEQWLKRKDSKFVIKLLGENRAELYLKGKITLTDLVSKNGRMLNLNELDI